MGHLSYPAGVARPPKLRPPLTAEQHAEAEARCRTHPGLATTRGFLVGDLDDARRTAEEFEAEVAAQEATEEPVAADELRGFLREAAEAAAMALDGFDIDVLALPRKFSSTAVAKVLRRASLIRALDALARAARKRRGVTAALTWVLVKHGCATAAAELRRSGTAEPDDLEAQLAAILTAPGTAHDANGWGGCEAVAAIALGAVTGLDPTYIAKLRRGRRPSK